MARIKIAIPEKKLAIITVSVRISDINYGNHMGNDALVSIIHEARVNWLKQNGYTEMDACGAGLIMGDLAVEYVSESFHGDVLNISIATGEFSRVGFDLIYLIEANRENKNLIIARAKTGMICYDYSHKKVMSIPEELKMLLSSHL